MKWISAAVIVLLMSCTAAEERNDSAGWQPDEPVEVVQFFSYVCSSCAEIENYMTEQGMYALSDVRFRLVPLSLGREAWRVYSRLYYSIQAIGRTGDLHQKVFTDVQQNNVNLLDSEVMAGWLDEHNVDFEPFIERWSSEETARLIDSGEQLAQSFSIRGTPAFIINREHVVIYDGSSESTAAKVLEAAGVE